MPTFPQVAEGAVVGLTAAGALQAERKSGSPCSPEIEQPVVQLDKENTLDYDQFKKNLTDIEEKEKKKGDIG